MKFKEIQKRMEETSQEFGVSKWSAEEAKCAIECLGGDPSFIDNQVNHPRGEPVVSGLMYIITLMLAREEKE